MHTIYYKYELEEEVYFAEKKISRLSKGIIRQINVSFLGYDDKGEAVQEVDYVVQLLDSCYQRHRQTVISEKYLFVSLEDALEYIKP